MYSLPMSTTAHCCRTCGATSYRRVIDRDEHGALRPTALYQCSGCSVVFADPKSWREGGVDLPAPAAPLTQARPLTVSSARPEAITPLAPDFSTYMQMPVASLGTRSEQSLGSDEKPAP